MRCVSQAWSTILRHILFHVNMDSFGTRTLSDALLAAGCLMQLRRNVYVIGPPLLCPRAPLLIICVLRKLSNALFYRISLSVEAAMRWV